METSHLGAAYCVYPKSDSIANAIMVFTRKRLINIYRFINSRRNTTKFQMEERMLGITKQCGEAITILVGYICKSITNDET